MVDEKGKQLGLLDREEALFRARQQQKDLVEIAPNAKPPVCKIIDFHKFRYQQEKKQAAGRKKPKGSETKEVRFSPFIAKNDYQTRIKRAEGFLKKGHKVKLTVRFKGRQMSRKQFGYELLEKVVKDLRAIAKVEQGPKMQGYLLSSFLNPLKNAETKNS